MSETGEAQARRARRRAIARAADNESRRARMDLVEAA